MKIREIEGVGDDREVIKEYDTDKIESQEEESQEEESQEEESQEEESQEEESQEEESQEEESQEEESQEEEFEITDEDVLSFLNKKHGSSFSSLDEVSFKKKDESAGESIDSLPEDVQKFLRFKNETGGSFKDFLVLNESFADGGEDNRIDQYLLATKEGAEKEDLPFLRKGITVDEDATDDEKSAAKLARKEVLSKAEKWFNEQKEQYGTSLESRESLVPEGEKETYEAFKKSLEDSQGAREKQELMRKKFVDGVNSLFNDKFKGFEFEVEEGKKIAFSNGSSDELRKDHSNPGAFIQKYLDENGAVKDVEGYHKALAVARNPSEFAKFFYDQGKSVAADGLMKELKNTDVKPRTMSIGGRTSKVKVREVSAPKASHMG
jgi:hypothetical protein